MIKFLDIFKQDQKLHVSMINDIKKLFKSGDFILGKEVLNFENNFKNFTKSKYAISCGNGTDALTIALKSLNLPNDSEVIIPAMTYCSTAFAVINAGLKVVLADTAFLKPTIDLFNLKKKINKKTKVILPVHLYGSVANLSGIKEIIKNKDIFLIDDCAQAHGSFDDSMNIKKKEKIGSTTDISCFSLYPGKNLGAYGDAGIITTNNKLLYDRIRKIRNLGSDKKFFHDHIGLNSRLDTIQAIILNKKIKNLTNFNKKRQKIAKFYNENILNKNIVKLNYTKSCVYHQYVILVKNKKKLINKLNSKKIGFGFHYPFAIHQLDVFKKMFKGKKFKNAERLAKEGISIPIDPNLKQVELKIIVNTLNGL